MIIFHYEKLIECDSSISKYTCKLYVSVRNICIGKKMTDKRERENDRIAKRKKQTGRKSYDNFSRMEIKKKGAAAIYSTIFLFRELN